MADSSGAGSSVPWWKSLTNRKKSKEASAGAQPAADELTSPPPPSPDWTSGSRENQHPNLFGSPGEPDKICGEKTGSSRRNLKISRSGRFKEKRKVRATLLPEGSNPRRSPAPLVTPKRKGSSPDAPGFPPPSATLTQPPVLSPRILPTPALDVSAHQIQNIHIKPPRLYYPEN